MGKNLENFSNGINNIKGCLFANPYLKSSLAIGLYMGWPWAEAFTHGQYAIQIGLASFALMYLLEKGTIGLILKTFDNLQDSNMHRKAKKVFNRSTYKKGSLQSNPTVLIALDEARETFDNMMNSSQLLNRWVDGETNPEESKAAENVRITVMRQAAKKHGVRFEDVEKEMKNQLHSLFGEEEDDD